MKQILIALSILVAAVASAAPPTSPFGYQPEPYHFAQAPVNTGVATVPLQYSVAYFYGLKSRQSAAVINTTFGTITNIFGKASWSLDASIFAGEVVKTTTPVGGFALGKSWHIATQVFLDAHIAVAVSQGYPVDIGPIVGISWKF